MGYVTAQVISNTANTNYRSKSHTLAGAMRKLADEIEDRGLLAGGTISLSISRYNSDDTYADVWSILGSPDE